MKFVRLVHIVVERYACSIGWNPLASVPSDRCRCKFVGQWWRCPNYHAISLTVLHYFAVNSYPKSKSDLPCFALLPRKSVDSCLHKNGASGQHCSTFKRKRRHTYNSYAPRTRRTPDSPARTPLTRGDTLSCIFTDMWDCN